jgi:pyruvate formate-lyase/glycerol dehydratase family glycyl radical enzyme
MISMADISINSISPWWVKSKAPWEGEIFDHMILQPGHPAELRVQQIRSSLLNHYEGGKRRLSCDMALIITRSYKSSEGLHPALRRALAMRQVFEEIPIDLLPGQLFMATQSSGPNIVDFVPYFMPYSPDEWEREANLDSYIDEAATRYVFFEKDQKAFKEVIWPYWKTRAREVYFFNELKNFDAEAWNFVKYGQAALYSPLVGNGQAHTIQDYATFLKKGLIAIQAEIRSELADIDSSNPRGVEDFERRNMYQSMLIASDGLLTYARRNAEFARSKAAEETDPVRKDELLEMACICEKVPAQPAETWWEALQAFHFLRAGTCMAESGDSHSAGRFDQYMLPYLQADLDSGSINREKAQELLECFFLKWNETRAFKLKLSVGSAGGSNNGKINLGGIDQYGRDVTNQLSTMLLEAHAHVHLNDPNLAVRLHRETPQTFLHQSLEVIRLGGGLPILINDEAIIPSLVSSCNVDLKDARNYGDVGCQENITDPNFGGADMNGRCNSGWINLPKPIELALNNGKNPLNDNQVSPKTGDPCTFATMEDFLNAVKIQIEFAVKMNVIANNVYDYTFTRYYPLVFHNLMHPGPRHSGIDMNAGGCRYNSTGCLAVGTANAGDILSAIDHLIFRTQKTSWVELLNALKRNWVGYEDLRRMAIASPKYGCDDEYADGWVRTMLGMYYDAYESHATTHGGHFVTGLISMSNYVPVGHYTGATPDGRKSGEPLADSTSPSVYAPVVGPTAAHRSMARAIDPYRVPNGVTFNQRFNSTAVMSERELNKWSDLVREFVDACGVEAQYTVVDSATLRDARKNPDQYRDLFVRVGGYSAVFVELSTEVQDSIIARAEQSI